MRKPKLHSTFHIIKLAIVVALSTAAAAAIGQTRHYLNACDDALAWDSFYTRGTGGNGSFQVFASGGNPFGYLRTQMTFPAAGAGFGVFLWSPFVYTPSAEGPISSIDLAQSRVTQNFSGWASTSLQYVFIMRQAGKTYMFYSSAPATPNIWQSQIFGGFTASNFWEQDESSGVPTWNSHPDFSSNGGPIQFGYHLGAGAANYDYLQGLDNYSISVNIGDPNIVFNGGFEQDLAGWTVGKVGESGVYVTEAGGGSKACYVGKGFENILHAEDSATIEQDLPPVRTEDVTGFNWRYRSFGATTETPLCVLEFTDGSAQAFGGGVSDGQWHKVSYDHSLPTGKVLKKISMVASGGLLRVVGFVDDIMISARTSAGRANYVANSGFEFSNQSPQNGLADFMGWEEGSADNSSGPALKLYSSEDLEDGPSDLKSSANESFVTGGSSTIAYLRQRNIVIDRSPSQIDAGTATYDFSGWLGGRGEDRDHAAATLRFLSATGVEITSVPLGTCGPLERENRTKMIFFQKTGVVPSGARKMDVLVDFNNLDGPSNDASIDDLGVSIIDSASHLEGSLSVPGFFGDPTKLQSIADFYRAQSGEFVGTSRLLAVSNGHYSVNSSVGPGIYNVVIRTKGALTRMMRGVRLAPDSVVTLGIEVLLGDANGDNYIGTDDYLVLNGSFGLRTGDIGYDARADFDGDKEVSTDDYLVLNLNFDMHGD